MADLASVQITVYGRVQGVFFRDFTSEHAAELALTGDVRNLPDWKSVKVRAEGEREKLERLIDYLKAGPPRARVERVETTWGKYSGSYSDFNVRY